MQLHLVMPLLQEMLGLGSTSKHPTETHFKGKWWSQGPNCQPLSIVRLKISAPSRKSTLLGVPKSGSDKRMFNKCFYLQLNGTRQNGKLVVTFKALSLPSPESSFNDLMRWEPPFCERRVGMRNCQYHWLSWSDVDAASEGVVQDVW